MTDTPTTIEGRCPRCQAPVDPLRAGAVSIVAGRIVHYCSSACREAHLRRERAAEAPSGGSAEETAQTEGVAEPGDEAEAFSAEGVDEARRGHPPVGGSSRSGLKMAVPYLVELGLILCAGVAVSIVPESPLRSMLVPAIAALVIAAGIGSGIFRERRSGAARMAESVAVPLAAAALVGVSLLEGGGRLLPGLALALLVIERFGRVFELLGRFRSGVLDVIRGAPPALLASEWRDNSAAAAIVRRITIFLEWARLPLAAGAGFLVWFTGAGTLAGAILAGATTLMAINPRALRMGTGDAHLTVALQAARRGVVIRDAHAVHRLASTRIVLFMAKRSLLLPGVKVVDWQVLDDKDPARIAEALMEAQSRAQGRFAEGIVEFLESMGISRHRETDVEVEVVEGQGIRAMTSRGGLVCGTRGIIMGEGISTARREPWAAQVEKTGRRAFFVALDGELAAVFGVEEEPVPQAHDVMRKLALMGFDPAMTTTAEVDATIAIGARMGIDNVRFESSEASLDSVLSEIASTGERVLLVGHGRAFEESVRTATAAMSLGSGDHSMAGVDARGRDLGAVVEILSFARSARSSVVANLTVAVVSLGIGLGLATNWYYGQTVVLAGALGFISCAFSAFNGPYLMLGKISASVRRVAMRVWKIARRGRPASS